MALLDHLGILGEPIRVRVLAILGDEQLTVGELVRVLQLPQSTVSRHLKVLRDGGWVSARSEGSASWIKAEPLEAGDPASRIWAVVLEDFLGSKQHLDDQGRLAAALADRVRDSRGFFGAVRGRWDALRDQLYGRDFWLPTLLSVLPGDRVVADLGCGTGEAVATLAPVVRRAIGVDREPAMIEAARVRCEGLANVDLRLGDLDALPLDDAEVDAALVMLVLHHAQDPAAALREAVRVVRPGGRVVLLDMVAHDRVEWAASMGHAHLGFARDVVSGLADAAGVTLRSVRDLPAGAEQLGPPLFLAVLERQTRGEA